MIPIKDNYKFGTDPTMEDQIRRTNNWIYKTKKSNLERPSGPVAQRIVSMVSGELCQKIAVSNPTQAGQRFTWSTMEGSNYWGSVTRFVIPIRGRGKSLEEGQKRSERRNNTKTT